MEAGKRGPGLTVSGRDFLLDGKKISIYSGAVHYFRSFPESWRGILEKLRAARFNTVETYVCWNLHEPEKGRFDFSGMLDIERFLALSQELGLYAIVRPGPYIAPNGTLEACPHGFSESRAYGSDAAILNSFVMSGSSTKSLR